MEYIILSSVYFNNAINIKNRIYVLKDELKNTDIKENYNDIIRRIEILKVMYDEAISTSKLLKEKGESILCQENKN